MGDRIPFRDGLFHERGGAVTLRASRCTACGKIYFPKANICVACAGEALEEAEIGPAAELFSFSTVHMPTQNFAPPYIAAIGLVAGVRVFAPLVEMAEPAIGAALALRPHVLRRDGDAEIIAYAFAPAAPHA